MYYVYQLTSKQLEIPLYIGLTEDPDKRFKQHVKTSSHIWRYVQDFCGPEATVHMEIVATAEDAKEGHKLEKDRIRSERPVFNIKHNEQFIFEGEIYKIIEPFISEDSGGQNTWSVINAFEDYLVANKDKLRRLVKALTPEVEA